VTPTKTDGNTGSSSSSSMERRPGTAPDVLSDGAYHPMVPGFPKVALEALGPNLAIATHTQVGVPAWSNGTYPKPHGWACERELVRGAKPVQLHVAPGWMRDWPYLPGIHRCRHSLCNVTHAPVAKPHARLYSVINTQEQKADADGAVLAAVTLESRATYPLYATRRFSHFFDLGVSYAHSHLGLQTSYNNYFPAQFLSRGAPFSNKRNALLWVASNCSKQQRNMMVQAPQAHIAVDSLGQCMRTGGGLQQVAVMWRWFSLNATCCKSPAPPTSINQLMLHL
jgi:hypothetical protein